MSHSTNKGYNKLILGHERKLFQDKKQVVWIRLNDYNNPRAALYLPEQYCKEAICETHDGIFGDTIPL